MIMQPSPRACPGCNGQLFISSDMWGHFYACEGCGFTAEDDDDIALPGRSSGAIVVRQMKIKQLSQTTERREIA